MSSSKTPSTTMKCLIQRVNQAQLLIDNKDEWVNIQFGTVVYVCLLKGCTLEQVQKMGMFVILLYTCIHLYQIIAKWIFTTKIFKSPNEQSLDTNQVYTINQLVQEQKVNFDIMIIPQACIGGKRKGTQFQYYSNIGREEGKVLYDSFLEELKKLASDHNELIKVVNGTYGNRQGLKFESDGPFTHILEA
jgi:D-tyrosyl-tRNA(Tyr) deacylase